MPFDFIDIVEDVSEKLHMAPVHLRRGSFVEDAISSGSLTYDLITGGGFPPGRLIILVGFEYSGKSTLVYSAIVDAIKKGVPCILIDPESGADPTYLENIGIDLSKVCGTLTPIKKKKKTKKEDSDDSKDKGKKKEDKWLHKPKLIYIPPETGEQVFRLIKRVLEEMPDKTLNPRDNSWIYVYEKGKQEKAKPGIEALLFIDSLASLMPEAFVEDDSKTPSAMLANMYSHRLKSIKTLLQKKRVTVIATNQMRINPRQRFGNPKYMVGGEAIKHYSDERVELTRCSVPGGDKGFIETAGKKEKAPPSKGAIEEEECWDGIGIDRYIYIALFVLKNRCFSPFRKSVLRIWFEEKGRSGRGIDPVYDTWRYLAETGQGIPKKGYYYIDTPFLKTTLRWKDFKQMILSPSKDSVDIRAECRKQIEDSSAFDLYFDRSGGIIKDIDILLCSNCKDFLKCKKENKVNSTQTACDKFEIKEEKVISTSASMNLDKTPE